ncbi:deubiquitinating protein VCPIP1-like [Saccostrea cucullata]|uniref:deubiquitinating protein VCPIP1-like n=1 Tax=Saccostrea cuccullata TaxID=36930 RepID=UPI002ED422DC
MLTVEGQVNFKTLQDMIYKAVKVPPERQKIRIGFPPKELKRPSDSDINEPIPLAHGDKISLEILPMIHSLSDSGAESSHHEHKALKHSASAPVKHKQKWSNFEEDIHHTPAFEPLLQSFHDQAGSNSLDAAVASLTIMATLKGRDLWTHVQTMPHLFSVGGLFYKQVERDLGLVDGKHCTLPTLPGKVFRYNEAENRLELCMEPYGHFQIEPGVENKAQESRPIFGSQSEGSFSAFSGAVGNKSKQTAFTGQGHSLKTMPDIEKMPEDIPENLHQHVRHSHTLCNPNVHQESIAEEPEDQMGVDPEKTRGGGGSGGEGYQRIGPGYSVISHSNENQTNKSVQQFKDLAESIERAMNEDICKIDEEMEKLDEEERKSRTSSINSPQNTASQEDNIFFNEDKTESTAEEKMEVTGSEEGRQPMSTSADDQSIS